MSSAGKTYDEDGPGWLGTDGCNRLHRNDGDGQLWFNDTALGNCAKCQAMWRCEKCTSRWLVIGLLSVGGLLVAAVLAFAAAVALHKHREWQAEEDKRERTAGSIVSRASRMPPARNDNDGNRLGAAEVARHAARSAQQIRHAWNTLATTTSGYQFLFLFQQNLAGLWPEVVKQWWDWLTRTVSLAFVRLDFIAEMFRSLCIDQWISGWLRLSATFMMLSAVFTASRVYAWWHNRKIPRVMRADLLLVKKPNDWKERLERLEEEHRAYVRYRETAAYHEAVGIAALSLLYSVLASKVAEPFTCTRDEEGNWWMRSDRTIQCFSDSAEGDLSPEWFSMAVASAAIFAVGIVAFPSFLFCKLLRANDAQMSGYDGAAETVKEARELNRDLIDTGYEYNYRSVVCQAGASMRNYIDASTTVYAGNFRVRYGWLYMRYDDRFWYWEFVIMARKLVFVAIGLLRDQRAIWALYMSLTVFALVVQLVCRPLAGRSYGGKLNNIECLSQYRRQWLQDRAGGSANIAESMNLVVQTITVGLGGFFAFHIVDETDTSSVAAKIICSVLIAINLLTLVPMLQLGYKTFQARCAPRDDDPSINSSGKRPDAQAPLLEREHEIAAVVFSGSE